MLSQPWEISELIQFQAIALFWASCLHPSSDGHSLPCRAAFSLLRPSSVPTNQVVRFGSSRRAWISAHSCLSTNSSDASRDGFIPATAPGSIESGGNVLRSLLGHRVDRAFARIGWGASRAQRVLTPYDSPSSSTLGFPASIIRDAFMEHLLSAYGPPAPSRPGAVPWRWRQPGNVGGDPRGVGCWTEASVWSCWGPFPGPRPMTGRLRMPPIIQLTEHKGATRGLGRPGARDGCTGGAGSPPQRARMCPEWRGQLSHAGMRTISSSLGGDKDREK